MVGTQRKLRAQNVTEPGVGWIHGASTGKREPPTHLWKLPSSTARHLHHYLTAHTSRPKFSASASAGGSIRMAG
ncbi:hypothetical protein Cob_v000623 [Colletotrichum orbiculare MAFF 240422]|uniref:Uncharacterized protein n=1 Tax=Colletotrichum orbiculare (strain 104-T / ATCC 96160 / CBS 514.97 / LARS 414 / MAFF 240422) TaxID=1213857 RepID=A0A484G905_COLOR|nr:hypothetical protein Cob_v000623 [Colletotrichum orbiculare MAFF 240422]